MESPDQLQASQSTENEESEDEGSSHEAEERNVEEDQSEEPVKKRRKCSKKDKSYWLDKTMRDKDFRLERSSYYSFKDTLGDWDERATQLLIKLIKKHPRTYFLLPRQSEKRLKHWEALHKEMEAAGYNFTVLQLRMRWREVLQKYRWTVNHNDLNETKKRCEYFDEMNELCGDWDKEATKALFRQINLLRQQNKFKKLMFMGYARWEQITENLNSEGYKFTLNMVEGRWRSLVTLYKTMIDHNSVPNLEPQVVAHANNLRQLVKYHPKRRNNYEKTVGRPIKLERFPASGYRILVQAYKDCATRFLDPDIDNKAVWDEITKRLEDEGLNCTTLKVKEIFWSMVKTFEKTQHHNSLPGAIKRDLPYLQGLAEVYQMQGCWPHLKAPSTGDVKVKRKYRLRLQASQQLWNPEESEALLQVYPKVLESDTTKSMNPNASGLWLQVAQAYSATGYPKRDVPEIAVHIALLRQGFDQNNNFPFSEGMRKVRKAEEAVGFTPDVSQYTGDVEITYWSHEAVNLLLELYMKHQSESTSAPHCSKDEVFGGICEAMEESGYKYTKEEISEQFMFLLNQYNTRRLKPWMPSPVGRQKRSPAGAPYQDKLEQVSKLRRKLSLTWVKGVKPLDVHDQKTVLRVACQRTEQLTNSKGTPERERERKFLLGQIADGIIAHIRTNKIMDPVPSYRQIRLHLAKAVSDPEEAVESKDAMTLYNRLKDMNLLDLLCNTSSESTSSCEKESNSKSKVNGAATKKGMTKKAKNLLPAPPNSSESGQQQQFCPVMKEWITEEVELSISNSPKSDKCSQYLTFGLSYFCNEWQNPKVRSLCIITCTASESGTGITAKVETFDETLTRSTDFVDESPVRREDDGLTESLMPNENTNEEKEEEEEGTIDTSLPFGENTLSCKDSDSSNIYAKIFGNIRSGSPSVHKKHRDGILCTVPSDSDNTLVLLLPSGFVSDEESALLREDNATSGKNQKQKSEKKMNTANHSVSSGQASKRKLSAEEGNPSVKHKRSDSVVDDDQPIFKTKLIQTRSGRKTCFKIFSQNPRYIDYDDDRDSGDGGSISGRSDRQDEGAVEPPKKKQKTGTKPSLEDEDSATPERDEDSSSTNTKKKGSKNVTSASSKGEGVKSDPSHDKHTTPNDGRPVNGVKPKKNSVKHPTKENVIKKKKGYPYEESVNSFIKNQHSRKIKQERMLVNVLKEHEREHNSILEEICNILEDFRHSC